MEGEIASKRNKRVLSANDFTEVIFSWSVEDIFDDNLYKDQVKPIPESFESTEDYLGSFVYPLLEEARAGLCSTMEVMGWAPFAEVLTLDESKASGIFTYNVKVNSWMNRSIDCGRELYKLLPGDVLVISESKPESVCDLQRMHWTWDFALVICPLSDTNEFEDDGSSSTRFRIKSSSDLTTKFGDKKPLYVVFLQNITTYKRTWSSLHMRQNLYIIQKVLGNDTLDAGSCSFCTDHDENPVDKRMQISSEFELNESQTESVLTSILLAKCDQNSHVELILGPPGTGKTKTISVILFSLLRLDHRTLSCAPTNVAVKEVAARVVYLVKKSFQTHPLNADEFCPLGEILLFGNKDKLKVGSDVEEIYLEYRVKRLQECLDPFKGWKPCVTAMIDFMEDCLDHYQVFVENEMIKIKEENDHDEIPKVNLKSLYQFCRDKFAALSPPLRRCMILLCTHMPISFILEQNFQNMVHLIFLLESLEVLLFQETLTSVELEDLFSHQQQSISEDSVNEVDDRASSLKNMRKQCLHTLKNLEKSLAELSFPRIVANNSLAPLMDFCYQNACLIFCTASSSFKLHHVDMKPIDLLVIDEAAQLKECESIIPLQLEGLKHAILVGDECQLPAIVNSKVSEDVEFGRSLFERLSSLGHSKKLLNIQYRMHPEISRFPNSNFYNNMIQDAPLVKRKGYERRYLVGKMYGPYSFINVAGGKEERVDDEYSLRNMVEVAVAMKLLQKLYKAWNGSERSLSIGLISPYAAQVAALQQKVCPKFENIDRFSVKVKSIDGFQGGEEDIIIFSAVRANNGGSIGFLSSQQRTNVALTRARYCLWILGNERTLSKRQSIWKTIILDAKDRQCFFDAHEDSDLSKTILDVKKEIDELDDLVGGDSILFEKGKWKVTFSDNFRKSFAKLMLVQKKKLVINLLLKLASGWRPRRKGVDSVCEGSTHVVKKFKVEGRYVICSIDIVKDGNYKQVLKVWDILSLDEISKLMRRLDSIFCMYTDDFINLCREKCLEGDLEVPKTWSASLNLIRYKDTDTSFGSDSGDTINGRSYIENSRVNESLLLMKFYSLSSGIVNHLLTYDAAGELDLPFEVTDEEQEVIQFPKSSFILGRSGTGKTTVLTMKLFQKEQIHHLAIEGYATTARGKEPTPNDVIMSLELDRSIDDAEETVLRQLFVTVSSKLCYAVKQHVSRLKSFACGGKNLSGTSSFDAEDMDEMDHFKDLPDSFKNIPAEKYPLVITFQHFLMMLDETLGDSYFERFDEIRVSSESSTRYKSVALQKFIRMKEVNFERFYLVYWPHLNVQMTKNLDPSRVFTEIITHIKGGLQAGDAPDCKLSREIYISMSDTRASTLSSEERGRVYNIFKDYEKMKMVRGEFDLADFVMDLHLRLKREGLKCAKMDFVYIDEVQDLTMRQISLFKYICQNVDEGFVFSGDTAQTIARGIDFRFEDIRSLFYSEFLTQPKDDNQSRKEKGRVSEMFNLYQNFRTHAGVLRLAQSVIDLLCHFFRQSVDFLRPESSLIYGEAPVLLEPGSDENAIVKIFGNAENSGGKIVGFGAEQVILVRDDSARKEISDYVGRNALVLTILECKGLEFQDVLLYNFFSASPLKNQWRVIYEYMKEKDLLDPKLPQCFPSFSHGRHCIMCSELKQLYVAITRTRQRLWICENQDELSKPMFDYWKKLCLVQVKKVDDSLAQAMQIASSPAEWKSRGIKLYWEKNYEMATLCFERARDTYWEKRAKASALRATAEYMRASNTKESNSILREAAEIFHSVGQAESAAECFCDLGEFERAGRIYLEKCGESELLKAGECFTLAKCYKQAAEAYAKGNHFSACLSACKDGKLFDLGLQYIESWRKQSQQCDNNTTGRSEKMEIIKQEFLESCAGSYYEAKDKNSMLKFVRAFNSMDSKRYFLKSKSCIDELLLLEEESGNFKEAAEIASQKGDVLMEADLLGKAGFHKEASLLIIAHVMSNSLWANGSRGWPPKNYSRMSIILEKARSFAKQDSDHLYELVCKEAMVLSIENLTLPVMLQCLCYSRNHESLRLESLSVRKILDAHLSTGAKKFAWDNELPDNLERYSEVQISKNQVSGRTLIYFWNMWFQSMCNVVKHLQCIKTQNIIIHTSIDEFCLNYFGVRRLGNDLDATYVLLNPDAQWVRKADSKFIGKTKNIVWIDADQFSLDAQSHCHEEIISVGLRVLETLEFLYNFSKRSSLSSFSQGMCLTDIYQVTVLLLEYFKFNDNFKWKLRRFLQLSTNYFDYVFPLDCRGSLVKNMISLRETADSQNLLEEVIDQNINGRSEVTYGLLGRVAMVLLGNGKKLTGEVCKKISERLDVNFQWKKFLTTLETSASGEFQGKASLVEDFNNAIRDTYNANWRVRDYISPHCFLYLVERLLIMVCHSKDSFYTTKCTFAEWIIHLESGAYPVASSVADMHSSRVDVIFDSLRMMILQLLHMSQDTKEWICGKNVYPVNYYSLVVQRMVIILCLLYLNTGKNLGVLLDIIGRIEYLHLLGHFTEPLRRGMRRNHANVNINTVAEAFKRVGIPLVIVSLGKNNTKIACPDAILVDVGVTTQRDDILEILFPKEKSNDRRLIPTINAKMPNPYGAFTTNENNHTGDVTVSQKVSSTTTGGGEGSQKKFQWVCFEEIFGVLKTVHDPSTLSSHLSKPKVQLGDNIKFLSGVLSAEKSRLDGGDYGGGFYDEASSMLEELEQLFSLLDGSNEELNGNLDRVEQNVKSIVSRKESLESVLNQLGGGGPDDNMVEEASLVDDASSWTMENEESESRDKPEPAYAASSGSGSKEVEEEDRVKAKEENKGKGKGKKKGKGKEKGNNKNKGKSKGGKKK